MAMHFSSEQSTTSFDPNLRKKLSTQRHAAISSITNNLSNTPSQMNSLQNVHQPRGRTKHGMSTGKPSGHTVNTTTHTSHAYVPPAHKNPLTFVPAKREEKEEYEDVDTIVEKCIDEIWDDFDDDGNDTLDY